MKTNANDNRPPLDERVLAWIHHLPVAPPAEVLETLGSLAREEGIRAHHVHAVLRAAEARMQVLFPTVDVDGLDESVPLRSFGPDLRIIETARAD